MTAPAPTYVTAEPQPVTYTAPPVYVTGGASITEPAGGQQLVYLQQPAQEPAGQQVYYVQQPAQQQTVTYAAPPAVQYVDERGNPVQFLEAPQQQTVTYAAPPTVQYVDERGQPVQFLEAPQPAVQYVDERGQPIQYMEALQAPAVFVLPPRPPRGRRRRRRQGRLRSDPMGFDSAARAAIPVRFDSVCFTSTGQGLPKLGAAIVFHVRCDTEMIRGRRPVFDPIRCHS
ncbi:unnamed protein product [Prorocentrum cordatum]|uniref:Uncharacterized protein n=1 Tax=Prorocentrum cordatum TaxID=2364126 RepID=A0ABN9PMS1_9DINO|nr:unnamed protein product [Polarella glacialis]